MLVSLVIRLVFVALCLLTCWSDVGLLLEARLGQIEPWLSRLGAVLLAARAVVLLAAAASVWLPRAWLFHEE